MKLAGGGLIAVSALAVGQLLSGDVGAAVADRSGVDAAPNVTTDGHLRPGHLETITLRGFPGRGVVEVAFLPTAICEDGCGGRTYESGRTDSRGAARLPVRMPNTFIDLRHRPVYFRDGERIEVSVSWKGPRDGFEVASASPQPILVRSSRRG